MTEQRGSATWDPSTPAPAELEPLRVLANTLDIYRGRDWLEDPASAARALNGTGLLSVEPTRDDLVVLRAARTQIRSILDPRSDGVDVTALVWRPTLVVTGRAVDLVSQTLHERIAALLLELMIAQRDRRGDRLRSCANDDCRWIFWDGSRPGTGRWCSMSVCGGQAKARRYRQRRAAQG